MPARIGVDLGSVQCHRAQVENPHLAGQQQHLDEQSLISFKNRRRNVAIGSWSGWSFAAMKRNATESYVARSSFRLENTPVA